MTTEEAGILRTADGATDRGIRVDDFSSEELARIVEKFQGIAPVGFREAHGRDVRPGAVAVYVMITGWRKC